MPIYIYQKILIYPIPPHFAPFQIQNLIILNFNYKKECQLLKVSTPFSQPTSLPSIALGKFVT